MTGVQMKLQFLRRAKLDNFRFGAFYILNILQISRRKKKLRGNCAIFAQNKTPPVCLLIGNLSCKNSLMFTS